MMMSTLERPHAPQPASAEPDLLGPVVLLALVGAMATFAAWPAVYATGIAAGGVRLWCRTRQLPVARYDGYGHLSRLLGALAGIGPLVALGCWGHYGLHHPLTHAGNGLAALALLLMGINEHFSPTPWLPPALRAERRFLARCWALAFTTAGAGAALFILPCYLQSRAATQAVWGLPVLLTLALSVWIARRHAARQRSAPAGLTYFGPLCSIAGTGMLTASSDGPALWLVLLPSLALIGIGLGLLSVMRLPAVSGRQAEAAGVAMARLMAVIPAFSAAVAAGGVMIVLRSGGAGADYSPVFILLLSFTLCGALATLMAETS